MLKINQFNRETDTAPEGSKMQVFQDTAMPYIDELYAGALRYTKNERDAEDLVQETFLKAYNNWERFKQGTNCRAWLFTILTNTFINKYRRKKKEREILNADDLRPIEQFFFNRENTDFYDGPDRELIRGSFSQDVKDALESLSDEFRTVVVLTDLNDFSYKEVAHILGCPVGTVMSRLFRGRKMMRRALVDTAYERGIIRDREPFLHEGSNRTRRSVRKEKFQEYQDKLDKAAA